VLVTALAVQAVLGVLAIAVVGRTLRAPPAALAVTVTFLPYVYLAVAALLLVGWAALPGRRTLPWLLAVVAVAAFSLWSPRWGHDALPDDGDDVRVMSWNLRRLWGGPDDGGDPISCVIATVTAAEPDVLTLLEVSRKDMDLLSGKLGLTCVHHAYTEDGGPKEGGLATCTRGKRWSLGEGSGQRFVDPDDWYYVSSEVRHGDRVFNVLAVHLFPYRYVAKTIRSSLTPLAHGDTQALAEVAARSELIAKSQADQSAALLERVDKFHDPTLVGGDFNSTRDSALHAALRQRMTDSWEHGGFGLGSTVFLFDWLPLRIDYVYASPEFRVRSSDVPKVGCSDHRPVVSDLVLSP
jgi:endonuclease/exonuclease/phosphatase (EEP) superfamily protein YafD